MVSQAIAVWILLAAAVAAANLPFVTDRLWAVIPIRRHSVKPVVYVVLEWAVLYGLVGFLGSAFEAALLNPFPRTWEFYVITLCIFAVLGFPGFVYRYLLKK